MAVAAVNSFTDPLPLSPFHRLLTKSDDNRNVDSRQISRPKRMWEAVCAILKNCGLLVAGTLTVVSIVATPPNLLIAGGILLATITAIFVKKLWGNFSKNAAMLKVDEKETSKSYSSKNGSDDIITPDLEFLKRHPELLAALLVKRTQQEAAKKGSCNISSTTQDPLLAAFEAIRSPNPDGSPRTKKQIEAEFRKLMIEVHKELSDGFINRTKHAEQILGNIEATKGILKLISSAEKITGKLSLIDSTKMSPLSGAISFTKNGATWLQHAFEAYRCQLRNEEIRHEEKKRNFLYEQLQETSDPATVRVILREIDNINRSIKKLQSLNAKAKKNFKQELVLGSLSGVSAVINFITKHCKLKKGVFKGLGYGLAALGLTSSTLSMAFALESLFKKGNKVHKSRRQIQKLKQELASAKKKPAIVRKIIAMRIGRQRRECQKGGVSIFKHILKLFSAIVAFSAPIKVILITAGVLLTSAAVVAFNVVGYVIIGLVIAALLLKIGYDIYKARYTILHFFQTADIPFRRYFTHNRYFRMEKIVNRAKEDRKKFEEQLHNAQRELATAETANADKKVVVGKRRQVSRLSRSLNKVQTTADKASKQMKETALLFKKLGERQRRAGETLKHNNWRKRLWHADTRQLHDFHNEVTDALKDPELAEAIAHYMRKNGAVLSLELKADDVLDFICSVGL